jgi:hypothetical protein
MFAHICGESVRMDEMCFFRMIMTEEHDYLLKRDAIHHYKVINNQLILKENLIPCEFDAIHIELGIEEYVNQYPIRHGFTNLLNCEFPTFKRSSINHDSTNENFITNEITN